MILGMGLILITLVVMGALFFKAKKSIAASRALAQGGHDLASFGYKQELLRDMGGFSNFALSFSIISILTGAITLYGYGFNQGGAGMMGYGWPLVLLFCLFLSSSLAELTSSIPTSGASYHWASILGGKGAGWFTAWFNLIGQITIIAGIAYGCAGFLSTLIFGEATKTEFLLIYAAILFTYAIFNHRGIHLVSILTSVSAIYHMVAVGVIIGLLVYFGPEQKIDYLFDTSFSTATSSSTPYWFAFLVGLLQAQWTITGYDASAHTSEETIDAKVRAPWGVYLSVAVSGIFGFLMLAVVTLSIVDQNAVAEAGANAFIVVMQQAIGGPIGEAIIWIVTLAMWFCGLFATTSCSRMIYSFARDGGLPFSKIWAHVSEKYATPANAIWGAVILSFLLGIFNNVYAVVTTLSVVGLHTSFLIPLVLKLRAKLSGAWHAEDDGPWNLGNWSFITNSIAVIWIIALNVILIIAPSDVPITNDYVLTYTTGKTFMALSILLVVGYFAYAKKQFAGPHLGMYQSLHDKLTNKETLEKDEARKIQ